MIKPMPNNEPVDILCHHSVGNKNMKSGKFLLSVFRTCSNEILVIPGAKLITIVRSIPSLYESSFGYFLNEVREYKEAKTIESFYSDPKKWFNPSKRNGMSQFAHNHLAFDLGYPTETVGEQNHAASDQIANEIVSTFDLILIRLISFL